MRRYRQWVGAPAPVTAGPPPAAAPPADAPSAPAAPPGTPEEKEEEGAGAGWAAEEEAEAVDRARLRQWGWHHNLAGQRTALACTEPRASLRVIRVRL
jgi:hypothetical protein